MSALAARRAAATTKSKTSFPSIKKTGISAPQASKRQSSRGPSSDPASPSELKERSTSPDPSSKRRRIETSSLPKPRYFAREVNDSSALGSKTVNGTRTKRVSPSIPADDVDDEDGADSSLDGETPERNARRMRDAVEDQAEEGRIRWSIPDDPRTVVPTEPSRPRTSGLPLSIERGVNIVQVSEEDLRLAGLADGIEGPGVLVSLSEAEDLMVAGMFHITSLQHSLSIFSTTLQPVSDNRGAQSHPVFAPVSHPLPVISTATTSESMGQLSSPILSRLALPSSFRLRDSGVGLHRIVFLIREHRSGLEGIRAGVVPGFSHIWLEERGPWGLRGVHPVIGSFPTPLYPYITPPSWQTALASVDKPSDSTDDDETTDDQNPIIALVKGPKRVGKSSFARSALNRLLRRYKKVAWLECDLGQGEFGCGGIVGIWIVDQPVLGPPFTHSRLPDVAHYLGTYAPLTCPDEYIAAIRHVLTFYRYQLQYPTGASSSDVVPLIINTQGWVKGLGEDLLRAIEESTEPTHIFNFESPSEEENAHPAGGGWTNSPPAHANGLPFVDSFAPLDNRSSPRAIQYILECAPTSPLQARYTSADLRILSLMTYLHFDFSSSKWNFSIPLLAMHPWQIEVGSSIEHIILIGEGADGVVEEDLTLALNGSMVALLETTEPLVGPAYVQGRSYPAFNDSNFLGLALVRDAVVSPTALKLHLLSPVPPAQLSKARILVKNGALELPLCGMIDWRSGGMSEDGLVGMKWEDVPFLDVAGVEVAGGERRRFRRNLMRKGM